MKAELQSLTACYSNKAYGELNLTPNFKVKEFACKDGSDPVIINILLPLICQAVRNWFGYPFTPNSGYRTITHNDKTGGSSSSLHIYGNAVDIPVPKSGGVTSVQLYAFLDKLLGDSCELIRYQWGCHVGIQEKKERLVN